MEASKKRDGKNKPFPTKLRSLMTDRGVTQQALADAIDVKRQTVSAYMEGAADPTLPKLWAMADYFAVSIDNLTGRHECTTPENEEIRKRLGLTDEAITVLEDNSEGFCTLATAPIPRILNTLLCAPDGRHALTCIDGYLFSDPRFILCEGPSIDDGTTTGVLAQSISIKVSEGDGRVTAIAIEPEGLANALILEAEMSLRELKGKQQRNDVTVKQKSP